MATDRQRDILRIALQEHVLQFETFDKNSAWALGERLKITCEKAAVATAIEIAEALALHQRIARKHCNGPHMGITARHLDCASCGVGKLLRPSSPDGLLKRLQYDRDLMPSFQPLPCLVQRQRNQPPLAADPAAIARKPDAVVLHIATRLYVRLTTETPATCLQRRQVLRHLGSM
ncbi:hypothetical protein PS850_05094 [Pseudomonas fluorescens]|nr:hypothetical protein PS850_05094 [Pseudomonas fluorescens]